MQTAIRLFSTVSVILFPAVLRAVRARVSSFITAALYLQSGLFLVCSSTQKCSSKEICAVLLSKMCSWQMDNIYKNSVNF